MVQGGKLKKIFVYCTSRRHFRGYPSGLILKFYYAKINLYENKNDSHYIDIYPVLSLNASILFEISGSGSF